MITFIDLLSPYFFDNVILKLNKNNKGKGIYNSDTNLRNSYLDNVNIYGTYNEGKVYSAGGSVGGRTNSKKFTPIPNFLKHLDDDNIQIDGEYLLKSNGDLYRYKYKYKQLMMENMKNILEKVKLFNSNKGKLYIITENNYLYEYYSYGLKIDDYDETLNTWDLYSEREKYINYYGPDDENYDSIKINNSNIFEIFNSNKNDEEYPRYEFNLFKLDENVSTISSSKYSFAIINLQKQLFVNNCSHNYKPSDKSNFYKIGNNFSKVEANSFEFLALKNNGNVYKGGRKNNFQLIDININIVDISMSEFHYVLLDSNGNVWTYGSNNQGELGHGDLTEREYPEIVNGLTNIIQISANERYTLCLRNDGVAFAFGSNKNGKLGISKKENFINNNHKKFVTSPMRVNISGYIISVNATENQSFFIVK